MGGIALRLFGPPKGSPGPLGPPGPPGPPGPLGAHLRAISKVSLICQGFSCCMLWGGGSSSPPGTMVQEMTSVVVAKVCVDIVQLPCVSRPIGVPCWVFLSLYGLPGPLVLIIAGVLLICSLIEGTDSSSVLG